jgi:hypothetical protein
MAVSYAKLYHELAAGEPIAVEMAKAVSADASKDALKHYEEIFQQAGLDNTKPGADTLRHLFVLMLGLGMRESSGRYCEGRDRSANNTSGETAEAGLLQTSFNARHASPLLPKLLRLHGQAHAELRGRFREGVRAKDAELENYGTGDGREFQKLSKECPSSPPRSPPSACGTSAGTGARSTAAPPRSRLTRTQCSRRAEAGRRGQARPAALVSRPLHHDTTSNLDLDGEALVAGSALRATLLLPRAAHAGVTLPAANSVEGYLCRLLINEVPFPGERGYTSEADTMLAMEGCCACSMRASSTSRRGIRSSRSPRCARQHHRHHHGRRREGAVRRLLPRRSGTPVMVPRITQRIDNLLEISGAGNRASLHGSSSTRRRSRGATRPAPLVPRPAQGRSRRQRRFRHRARVSLDDRRAAVQPGRQLRSHP